MQYSEIKRSDDTQSNNWGKLVQALDAQNLDQIERSVKPLMSSDIDDIGLLLPLAVEKGDVTVVSLLLHDKMQQDLRSKVLAKAEANGLLAKLANASLDINALVKNSYSRAKRKIPDALHAPVQAGSSSSNSSSTTNHAASSSSINPVANNQKIYLTDYAERGDVNAIQRADLDEFSPNEIGETLAIAVKNGNLPIIKSLLEGDRLDQDSREYTLKAAEEKYALLDHAVNATPEIRTILRDEGYKRAENMSVPEVLRNVNAQGRLVSLQQGMQSISLAASSSSARVAPMPVANTPESFYAAALRNDTVTMRSMLAERTFKDMPALLKGPAKDHAPLVHALKSNIDLVKFLMPFYETAKLEITDKIIELANDNMLGLLLETGTKNAEWHNCCNAIKNSSTDALMTVESYLNLRQDKAVLIQKLDGRGHELLQAARNSGNQTFVDVISNVYQHCNHPIPVKTGLQVTYQGQQQPGVPSAPPTQQHGFQQGN